MNSKPKATINIKKGMLNSVTTQVQNAGYIAPANDSDKRCVKAWKILEECSHQFSLRYQSEFDYSQMAPLDHEWILFFQSRDNANLQARINENKIKFGGNNPESLLRLPLLFERASGVFTPLGNGRAYTFKEMGIKYPAIVLNGDNMKESDFLELANNIAVESNRKNQDSIEPENNDDFIHQVATRVKLDKKDSKKKAWSNNEWKKHLDEWLQGIYELEGDAKRARRSSIINMALKDGRAESVPYPTSAEIAAIYQKYYPRSTWNPDDRDNVFQIEYTTVFSGLRAVFEQYWMNYDKPDANRKPAWLALRCGSSRDTSITSLEKVQKGKKKILEDLKNKYILSDHMIFAGKPLPERVLLLKQLNDPRDENEMWEWDIQAKEFYKL